MAETRGILLAAGFSRRFGANKLLQRLPDGSSIAAQAARHLVTALPDSIAVVRPGVLELEAVLKNAGLRITVCERAEEGMGVSLAHAVEAGGEASGFVIALADMPFITPATIAAVAAHLEAGASIVAPSYAGQRGHPVGIAARFRADLEALSGDAGAKALIGREGISFFEVDDAGVLRDIDTPDDLHGT